jgi:hypothetical protein
MAVAALAVFATAARADSYLGHTERPLAADRASVAPAATYLDDAAQGLSLSQSWVDAEVSAKPNLDEVLRADPTGTIAVAVLPASAELEAGPIDFAQKLRPRTSWPTVVVALGGQLSADSADLSSDQVVGIANESERVSGDLQTNLTEAVRGIGEALAASEADQTASAGGDLADSVGNFIGGVVKFVIGVAVLLLFLIGLAVFLAVRAYRRRHPAPNLKVSKATPGDVADHLDRLRDLHGRYLGLREPAPALAPAKAMAQSVAKLIADTSELFRRLDAKGGGEQLAVAQVEYRDQLAKVADVLGDGYYLDILVNPGLWENPAERARAVVDAVAAFSEQIIDNIKQVNASQDLRFQVSLDALARAKRDQSAGLYDAPDERSQP